MAFQSQLPVWPTASTIHSTPCFNSDSSRTFDWKLVQNRRCDVHVKKQDPIRYPEPPKGTTGKDIRKTTQFVPGQWPPSEWLGMQPEAKLAAFEEERAFVKEYTTAARKATVKVEQGEDIVRLDVRNIEVKTPSVKVEPRSRRRFADKTESSPTPSPKPSKSPKTTAPKHIFEPFSKVPRSVRKNNQEIKKLLLRTLLPKTELPSNGSVYGFTFPDNYRDTQPFLKIGYTNNIDRRISDWHSLCKYKPKKVFHFDTEMYVKVEKLVHLELRGMRKRETKCPGCGKMHDEWFDVSMLKATSSVALWVDFMRQEPYDELGVLKEKWRVRIEKVDLQDPRCWIALVDGGEELSEDSEDDSEDSEYNEDSEDDEDSE